MEFINLNVSRGYAQIPHQSEFVYTSFMSDKCCAAREISLWQRIIGLGLWLAPVRTFHKSHVNVAVSFFLHPNLRHLPRQTDKWGPLWLRCEINMFHLMRLLMWGNKLLSVLWHSTGFCYRVIKTECPRMMSPLFWTTSCLKTRFRFYTYQWDWSQNVEEIQMKANKSLILGRSWHILLCGFWHTMTSSYCTASSLCFLLPSDGK